MRLSNLALATLLVLAPLSGAPASPPKAAAAVADEAVNEALALPPGYKRDQVLRAVSRNLRWFGQPEAGVRAARAMSDAGVREVPPGTRPAPPRLVPLAQAFPTGDPCDEGLWREKGGGEARTPAAREAWARRCLLERDLHWIGLPDVALVRTATTGLPAGETKALVLAMLIGSYGDGDTLRFVLSEVDRHEAHFPKDARAGLRRMLAAPAALYKLGRNDEALTAARQARGFELKAELIRLLVRDGDAESALAVLEVLSSTPPEFGDHCENWFGPIGGLRLTYLGSATSPVPALGTFLDRLPGSATFRKACPTGLPADLAVEYLLVAGRLEAAVARAREARRAQPFLLVAAALEVGEAKLRQGERGTARAYASEAGAALPAFDPGDPPDPAHKTGVAVIDVDMGESRPVRNYGEASGNTDRRFQVIRLLAATGAMAEADALARAQPAGALRAVALSAAVAGRAGLRFDDQAHTLSGIDKDAL